MYKGATLQLTTGFATETLPARRKCQDILKVMKGKTKQNKTKKKTNKKKLQSRLISKDIIQI